jgi:hypothetical protein
MAILTSDDRLSRNDLVVVIVYSGNGVVKSTPINRIVILINNISVLYAEAVFASVKLVVVIGINPSRAAVTVHQAGNFILSPVAQADEVLKAVVGGVADDLVEVDIVVGVGVGLDAGALGQVGDLGSLAMLGLADDVALSLQLFSRLLPRTLPFWT